MLNLPSQAAFKGSVGSGDGTYKSSLDRFLNHLDFKQKAVDAANQDTWCKMPRPQT